MINPLTLAGSLLLLALSTPGALAQAYPTRAISLVVPATPGSGPDVVARMLAQKLAARMGQPVVVDNKPGASGNIGAGIVAKAQPDGYTLMVTINNFVITPALYKNLAYDPVNDFATISKLAEGNLALVVNPRALPVQTLNELAAHARAHPGQLNYGSPGSGSPVHLAVELLKQQLQLDIIHIPYKGMGGFMNDLLGGQVQLAMIPVHTALPYAKGGRLSVIAVSGENRSVLAPDLPSFGELGLKNLDIELYYWLAGPAGLARDIVQKLNQEAVTILASAEVRDSLLKQGMVPTSSTPEAMAALVRSDVARWHKFIEQHKIAAD
jgi:tripartite-type tricarboxylate transporter receptor subunit TctC